jgi:aspartate/methionine/tyrosine aminotransferase
MPIESESPEELGYGNIRCNLAESSVFDAKWQELGISLNDLTLAYTDHRGHPGLRKLIAGKYPGIDPEDVLITAGAASALFIAGTSLLEKENHLIVQFPNYATNLETPAAIGCGISHVELKFENSFRFSTGEIEKQITQHTKLVSITTPHNPTGTTLSLDGMNELIQLAERKDCFLLADETYRDLGLGEKLPLAASLSENVISISSISKAHGLPGLRIGWLITKNKNLQEIFLAAKEQIFICNSVVDEEIVFQYLQKSASREALIAQHVKNNFAIVESWMKEDLFLEWIKPSGGCVCFPRFRQEIKMDTAAFYKTLLEKYSTYVGPGHWFGMDDRYMRIGFGWPGEAELKEGLSAINSTASGLIK